MVSKVMDNIFCYSLIEFSKIPNSQMYGYVRIFNVHASNTYILPYTHAYTYRQADFTKTFGHHDGNSRSFPLGHD